MNNNSLDYVSTYFRSTNGAPAIAHQFNKTQVYYQNHRVAKDGSIEIRRDIAQRVVESWTTLGDYGDQRYVYTLPEQVIVTYTAYHHIEDGQTWLRITPSDGTDCDEPIGGWALVLDLTTGKSVYRNKDGRQYDAV